MNTQRSTEERLWDYIDGLASADEKTFIEQRIASDAEWKAQYQSLLEAHRLMQEAELEQPSMRFTKNVMEEIARLHIAPATKTYINKRIIWGIALFFITLFVGFLAYGFGQMEWRSSGNDLVLKSVSQFDISKFFSNTWVNAFMMVNVVIGLFLLDNYLNSKRKKFRKV